MVTRRKFLGSSALAVASTHPVCAFAQAPARSANVTTASGQLRGKLKDGIASFRGVPFAQPPVGPLRFRPAQPLTPWSGVIEAREFAPEAIQVASVDIPQSEDCLYLNIWTPIEGNALPVFVWIHGGGFMSGRSFDPTFDGAKFARDGIVSVTVPYRLGALGFLDLEPILGTSYAGSANNGISDLIEALRWIQRNIAAFGGDPARITIGGQSAGAKLVDLLMGVPSATPLFHQMISESGGADRIWSKGAAFKVAKNFSSSWSGATHLGEAGISSASARQLVSAQEELSSESAIHFPLRAEIDGTLIPQHPLLSIRQNSCRGKRLLIGNNREESAAFVGPHPEADPTQKDLGNIPLAQFAPVFEGYKKLYPNNPIERTRLWALTAEEYGVPSIRVAQAHANAGNDTYVYRLDFPDHDGRYAGLVPHSAELRFVWDQTHSLSSPGAQALALSMHAAWVAFIKGDVPSGPDLPVWSTYTVLEQQTMVFNAKSNLESGPQTAELALWEGLLI